MTFKHKLSCRLALMRDRWMVLSTVALALAALAACEKPISLTGPDTSAVLRLVISPKVLTLRPHQVADFTAVGLTSTGVTGSTHVSWSVTSGSMTDTSTTGDQHYARYQAGADAGAAKVVVSGRPGGIADTAIISVMPAPVASVAVSPATMSVQVGGTVQLAAATKDSAGNPLSGRAVAWMSSNPAIAAASPSGLVTAVAAGAATITATSEGKSGTASVTVTTLPPPPPPPPAPVATVTVSPASASLTVGQSVQLNATLKDASGNVLNGRTVSWASGTSGVATVSGSGLVTGVAAGTATITATSEGKSGTALIVVASAPPPGTNPNEPSGYTRFAEHDFSTPITQSTPSATGLMGLWAIDDPTLLPNMTYAVDLGAPRSAPQVFQGKFPAGLQGGFTSIKWQGWDAAADGNSYGTEMREIYLSMWIKIVGPDYENQPVAGTKMGFFGYAEPKSSPGNQGVPKIKVDSPQIRSDFNLRFEQQNTVDRILDQNVDTRRLMTCGVWHRWEMVLRLNTLGVTDGVLRWWVDGTLIMDYSDVTYITPGNTLGFYTFKFWPYWGGIGGSKTRDDYMQVDHIYISGIKK